MMGNSYSYTDRIDGRTIVFCGPDNQPGVTMISKASAELLEKEGYNVLFISADRYGNCHYSNAMFNSYMEDMAALLEAKETEREQINFICSHIVSDGLMDMIPGLRSAAGGRAIYDDFLPTVCKCMKRIYDFIVIDAGCNMVDGPSAGALRAAERLYLVTTQQEKSFERMKKILPALENYPGNEEKMMYIINKFNDSPVFDSIKEMGDRLGCEKKRILKVEYVPFGWQAEKERKTLLWNRKFSHGIKDIAADILRGSRDE